MINNPLSLGCFLLLLLAPVAPAQKFANAQKAATAQDAATEQAGPQDPELSKDGRKHYLGREIARTMHWTGAEWLMRETRADEENSQLMREKLGVAAGQTVCDLGCGNGYYTLPMAQAVGAEGKVFAVDIQKPMLTMLAGRVKEAGYTNVEGILCTVSDPKLPPNSCDLIIMVDVYHEISHPVTVLRHLRAALKPKGQVVLVEFRTEDPKVPIKRLHKMSKAQVITEMAANGLRFERGFDGLPWQHLMAFGVDPNWPGEGEEGEREEYIGRAVAEGLMRSVLSGDVQSLSGFYAPEVDVHAGSEFLKAQWGGSAEARTEGQTIKRDAWLRRYARSIQEIGIDKWQSAMNTSSTEHAVRAADNSWEDSRKGDLVLDLVPVAGGDHLYWSLRRGANGQWHVISEQTDF